MPQSHLPNGQFSGIPRPKIKRKPSKRNEMIAHSYDFERITHKLLLHLSKQLGLDDPPKPVTSQPNGDTKPATVAEPVNGHNGAVNGDAAKDGTGKGEESSQSLEISREIANIIVGITRSWDMAAERVRILKGVPMPGSRRPAEAVPKPRKPRNKPPDTLADMPVSQ